MIVLPLGPPNYEDTALFREVLDKLDARKRHAGIGKIRLMLHGGRACGVDSMARMWAAMREVPVKRVGIVAPSVVVLFPGGDQLAARRFGVKVIEVP